ncbi:MAG: EAL domain-containing protein, partial [Clostridia bacterium]|nr:EAL domain-containing protein [Clostridia bacterium]
GWKFEYIEASWPDLMQMLVDGKIDLMSDVSFSEDRAKTMLFSNRPMGTEEYYLFANPSDISGNTSDYSSLNGKSVGINKGSIQVELFKEWEKTNKVQMKIVELSTSVAESIEMLSAGKIDFLVSPETMSKSAYITPVCEIGSSDFFFAVNKSRSDLMMELNSSMSKILDENPYYNLQLYSKYLQFSRINKYLDSEELEWLDNHKKIRVGYQDNYLAFCAKDPQTGELIGALSDYLNEAKSCMENAEIEFETISYPTSNDAFDALKNGEIDCMFPANLTDYYGEEEGLYITDALMSTEMSAIIQESQKSSFFSKERVTVAVNSGNTNYDMFLVNHFPEWRSLYFKDSIECLKAISQGRADCLIISNYRYNNLSATCTKLGLTSVPVGVEMDYCFAVKEGNTTLYAILNKVNSSIPQITVNTALSNYYMAENRETHFSDFLIENITLIVVVTVVVSLFVAFLVRRKAQAESKAAEHEEIINATEKDRKTDLYVRSYFFEYAARYYAGHPDDPMDAIVINITNFHSVNAINGYDFGDRVLRELAEEIQAFLADNGGIATRTEADHFAIYCHHIENPITLYNQLQDRLDTIKSLTSLQIRMGVMSWQGSMEPQQMIDNAIIACNLSQNILGEHMLVYKDEMREKEIFDQKLLNDLNGAIENGEFIVNYQPKFDIQQEPAKLVGAEALVRWMHPELGRLTPVQFIGLFEKAGRISILDKYVFKKAVEQVALWKEKYGVIIPVSINLSRIDVMDPLLEETIEMTLEEKGLSHDAIRLEVTESAYIENEKAFIGVITSLRNKGFKIEMDDFGSAYSSLNMLSEMPIDSLKMDREFVRNIDTDEKQYKLVELIMGIAESIEVPVIAEGVETEAQLEVLKKLGCSTVQGFVFSPALSADDFEKRIIEKNLDH